MHDWLVGFCRSVELSDGRVCQKLTKIRNILDHLVITFDHVYCFLKYPDLIDSGLIVVIWMSRDSRTEPE